MSFKISGPNEIMKVRQNQVSILVQLMKFMISRSFYILPEALFLIRFTLMLRNNSLINICTKLAQQNRICFEIPKLKVAEQRPRWD